MSSDSEAKNAGQRVITGTLQRVRRGREKRFVEETQPPREAVRRPARVAIALALAHKIEEAIQRGVARDRAEVARRLGLTRARVTQLADLTLLARDIQEQVLGLESVDGLEPMSERTARGVARTGTWAAQRAAWRQAQR